MPASNFSRACARRRKLRIKPATNERVCMALLRSKVPAAFAALALIALTALALVPNTASAGQLAVFGSARCPYCLAWEREIGRIYPKTQEARLAPLRRIDIQARRPADLAQIKEVHVAPTFVLIDEGREVGRIVGYSGEKSFWGQLHRLLARLHPKES